MITTNMSLQTYLFSGIDYDSDAAETQLDRFIRQTQAAATHYGGTLLNHR